MKSFENSKKNLKKNSKSNLRSKKLLKLKKNKRGGGGGLSRSKSSYKVTPITPITSINKTLPRTSTQQPYNASAEFMSAMKLPGFMNNNSNLPAIPISQQFTHFSYLYNSLSNERLLEKIMVAKNIFIFDFDCTLSSKHSSGTPSYGVLYLDSAQIRVVSQIFLQIIAMSDPLIIILSRSVEELLRNNFKQYSLNVPDDCILGANTDGNKNGTEFPEFINNLTKLDVGENVDQIRTNKRAFIESLWSIKKANAIKFICDKKPIDNKIYFFDDTQKNIDIFNNSVLDEELVKCGLQKPKYNLPNLIARKVNNQCTNASRNLEAVFLDTIREHTPFQNIYGRRIEPLSSRGASANVRSPYVLSSPPRQLQLPRAAAAASPPTTSPRRAPPPLPVGNNSPLTVPQPPRAKSPGQFMAESRAAALSRAAAQAAKPVSAKGAPAKPPRGRLTPNAAEQVRISQAAATTL